MRDPKALIEKMNSDVQIVEGTSDIIIRGSRPGDAIYYIGGVKTANMSSIPGVAIVIVGMHRPVSFAATTS